MELINKLHPKIAEYGSKGQKFIRITKAEFFFSKAAVNYIGLEKGKYLHFLIDNTLWHFYQSDISTGFKLSIKNKDGNLHIRSEALSQLFLEKIKYEKLPLKFDIIKILGEYAGQKLFKIQTQKTL